MKTIMAKTPHDSSFSFSRRYFNWNSKKIIERDINNNIGGDDNDRETLTSNTSSHFSSCDDDDRHLGITLPPHSHKKKLSLTAVFKLPSLLAVLSHHRLTYNSCSSTKLIGTLFGYRRGHVHFAFQEDAKLNPTFLIELATPTSVLVKEMASGLVRIALECEKRPQKKQVKLLEEHVWRTYCNGKKCGYGVRRECGSEDWKIFKAVEPISMGAGVLPGNESGSEGELMYLRARFERVVGSKDSEAFYMMNPDGSGGPELSVYLLRV